MGKVVQFAGKKAFDEKEIYYNEEENNEMEKVLIFTHKNDIDGMGSAVLAKLAFYEADYVLCSTFELQKAVENYIDSGKIYEYDMVFITDLWLKDPVFSKLASDERMRGKWIIMDHHKTSYLHREASLAHNDVEAFQTVIEIENENGLCCGTSLFYEYLIEKQILNRGSSIGEFVELTRRHDTWEWRTKYNDEKARELALLFEILGPEGYIETMCDRMLYAKIGDVFGFTEFEKMLIETKKKMVAEMVKYYADNMHIRDVMGFKAGVAFINYEYRNELGEYLREQKYDIDFVMLVSLDQGSISYRTVKDGVNVSEVAVAMGGKGHDNAATNPLSKMQKKAIADIVTDVSISAIFEKEE